MSLLLRALIVGLLVTAMGGFCPARAEQEVPKELQGIAIDGTLGAKVPLDVPFVDHTGKQVFLRDYFVSGRPVVLVLAYYSCPTLCSLVLNGLLDGMRAQQFVPGKDYQVVTLSIDPREKPNLAAAKRQAYLQALGRPLADESRDWPFLSGTEQDIAKVASAVGFHYRWDEEGKQWAHAAGIFVLTPSGWLSQILYERALKADPNHVRTWQYYGLWQVEQGNRDQAQYHLSRIAAISGTSSAEYRSLAEALEKPPGTGLVY
mgnify:CR=1 FL=1